VVQVESLKQFLQLSGHITEQSSPENPESQTQKPFTHLPDPKQAAGQGASLHKILELGQ
jgi:hypothetical protein